MSARAGAVTAVRLALDEHVGIVVVAAAKAMCAMLGGMRAEEGEVSPKALSIVCRMRIIRCTIASCWILKAMCAMLGGMHAEEREVS